MDRRGGRERVRNKGGRGKERETERICKRLGGTMTCFEEFYFNDSITGYPTLFTHKYQYPQYRWLSRLQV